MKRFRLKKIFSFILSLLLLPLHFVFATELSSIGVTTTSHLTSEDVNYKFTFVLDGSATWDGGEYLTITFPSGYTVPSSPAFSEDDVDIADDGVDLTTAADCTGSEQMGVSVSGNAITFTMCSGDGGDIASGSTVEIEMGLNASSSGTGASQITNPSAAGSFFIDFSGTFGDDGSVVVPITASSGDGVSVTVPDPDGGGGGGGCESCGGGGGGDEEPEPVFDEIPPEDPDEVPPDEVSPTPPYDPQTPPDEPPGGPNIPPDEVPPDEVPPEGSNTSSFLYDITAYKEDIDLPIVDQTVQVLSHSSVAVRVEILDGDITSLSFDAGSAIYPFFEDASHEWIGEISVSDVSLSGVLIFTDGQDVLATLPLIFEPSLGLVYESIDGVSVGVADAEVTLLTSDGYFWDGTRYGESSSMMTNETGGGFGWYVPNGDYILRVEKNSYEAGRTQVTVSNGVLTPVLYISKLTDEVIVLEAPPSIGGVSESIRDFLSDVTENVFNVTPETRTFSSLFIPIAVSLSLVAASAAGLGQLWLLLYSFFSQPLLFFTRKKKRSMGIVYHSVTKVPIDLAIVRAFDIRNGKLVKTVVTNEKGEFFLRITREGIYRLQVVKQGFVFPSVYLSGVKEDGAYLDVYSGQPIAVAAHAEPIAVAIPLDPVDSVVPAKILRWQRLKRRVALALSPISVLFSVGIALLYPSLFTVSLLCLQILLFVLIWRITHRKEKKTWGIVYDDVTHKPVGNVMIRLFEPKYNKLVESVLSDARGRYVFALGPNRYSATFAKDGYQDTTIPTIDLTAKKEISLFGVKTPLRRMRRDRS